MAGLEDNKRPGKLSRTLIVYGAVLAVLFAYANFATTWDSWGRSDGPSTIGIVRPRVVAAVDWFMLGMVIALGLVSIVSFKRRLLRWPVVGLLICLLYPYSLLSRVFSNLAPWTTHAEVTLSDGATYVFLDTSFLQGQTMAIGRVQQEGLLTRTFEELVSNNGDSPRSWCSVVRPSDSSEGYGQLYAGRGGVLVGVRHDNRCYLAFDVPSKIAYGHEDVEKLSPFVCLREGDDLQAADIERTCAQIGDHAAYCTEKGDDRSARAFLAGEPVPGCPSRAAIRDALQSNQANIAEAAAELDSCYDNAFAAVRKAWPDAEDNPSSPDESR